jgi:hypothetical protein
MVTKNGKIQAKAKDREILSQGRRSRFLTLFGEGGAPELDGTIVAARGETGTVGREDQTVDGQLVALQFQE